MTNYLRIKDYGDYKCNTKISGFHLYDFYILKTNMLRFCYTKRLGTFSVYP